jgi:hypothetical protein
MECSTINIDDYEQFPPLGKEEFTSTPAKSFSVPSVDPDTTINYGLPITVLAACMVHVHE